MRMKKGLHVFSFICSIMFSAKAFCGILQLTDPEKEQQNFSRILRNLENFYSVNAQQITILNQEKFFDNPQDPSPKSLRALKAIKRNTDASIQEITERSFLNVRSILEN